MSGDGASFSHVSLHVDADWLVRCNTYDDTTPILSIDAGPIALNISVKWRNTDESAVEFARALVRNAQAFAAEVERCHAEHATPDTTDRPDLAA